MSGLGDTLNTLLDLDTLRFGDGSVLGWAHPIPAWAWLLIVLAAVIVSAWGYARLRGPAPARAALAGVRTLLLVLLAVLAAGPRLEKARTEVERDRLVVLLDRSASMRVADLGGETRDDAMRALLGEHADVWTSFEKNKDLVWLGFGGGITTIDDPRPDALPSADAPRSALGAAITEARRRTTGHPLSGIVLISDGRSSDEPEAETLRALRAEHVPVHVVPLGALGRGSDLAVTSATGPGVAFVDDSVPVRVRFHADNIDTPGAFEIVDERTGEVLRRRALTADELASGEVTISAEAGSPGEQRWAVRYIPDGPDLAPQNNTAHIAVRFVDEPIRVLYVDGSPRWEHRYLKSLLIREDSIDSSCLLLAVNRRFQQEGDTPIDTLPESPEAWDEYDVVIIGDISPELFGERTLAQIRRHVGEQGAGLLWLAGPSATPGAWADTPLADLLPITASGGGAGSPRWPGAVVLRPTPVGVRAGLLAGQADEPMFGGIADPAAGWSALRWALKIDPSMQKTAAETLALAVPVDDTSAPSPLVLSMRYGAGRTALVGTDEIWRWRYGRGETPTERFWLPLLRMLARPRLASIGAAAVLNISPAVAETGQVVSVELTVTDQSIAEILPAEIDADVTPTAGDAGVGIVDGTERVVRLSRRAEGGTGRSRYAASMQALTPGSFTVRIPGDRLAGTAVQASLEVIAPDDEMRNPQTNHPLLARIAEATGGRVLSPDDLDDLPRLLPNRTIIVPLPPESETLWDRPFVLGVLLVLLTIEWVGRRLIRLT